jgi:hypothetical protein
LRLALLIGCRCRGSARLTQFVVVSGGNMGIHLKSKNPLISYTTR